MTTYPRYALYYVPSANSALYRFGAEALGYDVYTGETLPFPSELLRDIPDWSEVTREPRKYGFHGTLKAPFALAEGKTEADLIAACEAFASTRSETPVLKPVITRIGGFIAITPGEINDSLNQLAQDCVVDFDPFRAPMTPVDRARRKPESLSETQRSHLDRWGYPYVMEEFRFHMTLTGHLSPERGADILARLQADFVASDAHAVNAIALVKQTNSGDRFNHLRTFAFRA